MRISQTVTLRYPDDRRPARDDVPPAARHTVSIRQLTGVVLLRLLSGGFSLTIPEIIGLQAEADRRRERGRSLIGGRYRHRPAPRRFNDRSHNAGYFDARYFDAESREGGNRYAVTF